MRWRKRENNDLLDFKVNLAQEQSLKRLQLTTSNEAPSDANVFRCFAEFRQGHNFLKDEEHAGRL